MIDAYTIGVRLTLSDEVSAGLKTVRRELTALDRAASASGARLVALRHLGSSRDPTGGMATTRYDRAGLPRFRAAAPMTTPQAPVIRLAAPSPRAGAAARVAPTSVELLARVLTDMGRRLIRHQAVSVPRRLPPPPIKIAPPAANQRSERARTAATGPARTSTTAVAPAAIKTNDIRTPMLSSRILAQSRQTKLRLSEPLPKVPNSAISIRVQPTRSRGQRPPTTAAPRSSPSPLTTRPAAPGLDLSKFARAMMMPCATLSAAGVKLPAHAISGPATGRELVWRARARRLDHRAAPRAFMRVRSSAFLPPSDGRSPTWNDSALVRHRPTPLPVGPLSLALHTARAPGLSQAAKVAPSRNRVAPTTPPPEVGSGTAGRMDAGEIVLDGVRFGRLVAEQLAVLMDRPHGGITGANPRVSAVWPGASIG